MFSFSPCPFFHLFSSSSLIRIFFATATGRYNWFTLGPIIALFTQSSYLILTNLKLLHDSWRALSLMSESVHLNFISWLFNCILCAHSIKPYYLSIVTIMDTVTCRVFSSLGFVLQHSLRTFKLINYIVSSQSGFVCIIIISNSWIYLRCVSSRSTIIFLFFFYSMTASFFFLFFFLTLPPHLRCISIWYISPKV